MFWTGMQSGFAILRSQSDSSVPSRCLASAQIIIAASRQLLESTLEL